MGSGEGGGGEVVILLACKSLSKARLWWHSYCRMPSDSIFAAKITKGLDVNNTVCHAVEKRLVLFPNPEGIE